MITIGTKVMALDDDICGVVTAINQQVVEFETTDGFTMSYPIHKLIIDHNQLDLMRSSNLKSTPNKDLYEKKKTPTPFKTKKNEFILEVDLHIEKLVPSYKGLTNYDILNIQIDHAKRQLEFAISKRFPKVVFIHGVGEGVLKSDLHFMLGRYDTIRFQDANYQVYGMGATEITILQR